MPDAGGPDGGSQPNVVVSVGAPIRTLPAGFSSYNWAAPEGALKYTDPQASSLMASLNGGWVNFPGGTVGNAHNWETGDMAASLVPFPFTGPSQWVCGVEATVSPSGTLSSPCPAHSGQAFVAAAQITNMGKGYSPFSAFKTFAGSRPVIVTANAFTDTPAHVGQLAQTACAANNGVNVIAFQLANEGYFYPGRWTNGAAHVADMAAYRTAIASACPGVPIALFYAGQYWGGPPLAPDWDSGLFANTPGWDAIATHLYPSTSNAACGGTCTLDTVMADLNGFLVNGSNAYLDSYFVSKKPNAQIIITEFNLGGGPARTLVGGLMYQAIFLSEYITRVSSDAHVLAIGAHQLYAPGGGSGSMFDATNDHTSEVATAATSGTGPIDTTGWNFGFAPSVPARGLALINGVLNSHPEVRATSTSAGPAGATTVATSAQSTDTAPAVFAQAYGTAQSASRSLILINKGAQSQVVSVDENGVEVTSTLTLTTLSGTSGGDPIPTSATVTVRSPFVLSPYTVARLDYSHP
jgi:hypothetical protein